MLPDYIYERNKNAGNKENQTDSEELTSCQDIERQRSERRVSLHSLLDTLCNIIDDNLPDYTIITKNYVYKRMDRSADRTYLSTYKFDEILCTYGITGLNTRRFCIYKNERYLDDSTNDSNDFNKSNYEKRNERRQDYRRDKNYQERNYASRIDKEIRREDDVRKIQKEAKETKERIVQNNEPKI